MKKFKTVKAFAVFNQYSNMMDCVRWTEKDIKEETSCYGDGFYYQRIEVRIPIISKKRKP